MGAISSEQKEWIVTTTEGVSDWITPNIPTGEKIFDVMAVMEGQANPLPQQFTVTSFWLSNKFVEISQDRTQFRIHLLHRDGTAFTDYTTGPNGLVDFVVDISYN